MQRNSAQSILSSRLYDTNYFVPDLLLVAVLQPQLMIVTTYDLHKHNETRGCVCVCVSEYT